MVLFPQLSARLEAVEADSAGTVKSGYIPHPRATSHQLEESARSAVPAPEILVPLLPKPHPFAGLIVAALPPPSDAFPPSHPLRRSAMTRILIWQLSSYVRNVHKSYQQWVRLDSDQCLACPWIFTTQEMARRFLALRRVNGVKDTPDAERGSLGEVYWSADAVASILPTDLRPFGT